MYYNIFTLYYINLFSFKNFSSPFEYSIEFFNNSLLNVIIFCLFSFNSNNFFMTLLFIKRLNLIFPSESSNLSVLLLLSSAVS